MPTMTQEPTTDQDFATSKKVTREQTSIFDRAICLSLEIGCIGSHRKVDKAAVTIDADKEYIGVSKSLMECDELKNIKRVQSELRQWLYAQSLPAPMFRAGVYLVPVTLLESVDARLNGFDTRITEMVEAFIAVYPNLIERDKEKLRGVFNLGDYPSVSKVRAAFYVNWQYIAFGVPQNLPSGMFAREQEKARNKLAEATDSLQQVLRAQMLDLVEHMRERLTPEPGAKPKIFRDSLVQNIRDFLTSFRDRNITDDDELQAVVDRAGALLAGVDPENLRDSDVLKEKVRTGFTDMKQALDAMITERPTRRIKLDDDEEEK